MRLTNGAPACLAYVQVLRPGLVKGQWSAEEDIVLMKLATSGYKNWGVLSNHMPGESFARLLWFCLALRLLKLCLWNNEIVFFRLPANCFWLCLVVGCRFSVVQPRLSIALSGVGVAEMTLVRYSST